MFVLIKQ